MAEYWHTPRLKAEPPATDATLNEETLLLGEAPTQPQKLDSMLHEPHRRQKEDGASGETSATGAGFTNHENSEMSRVTGETEEKLVFHNEIVPGASTNSKLDVQSNQQDDETNATITEEEIASDDGDATSQTNMQSSRIERRESVQVSGPMRKSLKKRIAQVPGQLTQQAEYTKLVEDRLAELERRMEEMERRRSHVIADEEHTMSITSDSRAVTPEPTERYTEIVGINRVSFEQYKPKKPREPRATYFANGEHCYEPARLPESPPRHIVDIVLPHISTGEIPQNNASNKASEVATATNTLPGVGAVEGLAQRDTQQVVPERIRINSSLLLESIELATNLDFTITQIPGLPDTLSTQVILRPFKSLVTYEPEIRKYAQSVKERVALFHAQDSASTQAVESSGEPSVDLLTTETNSSRPEGAFGSKNPRANKTTTKSVDESTVVVKEDIEESGRRLQELETLIEVLDNDLKPVFDLRRRIENADISSIAYCDLWHLFRIGGEVCVNEAHSQVYRIVDIRGGRPALCTRGDAEMRMDKWEFVDPLGKQNDHTALTINCFCYGFDGKQLGPVQRIFEIDAYDDLKPINSLLIYPVEFSGTKDGDLKREDFILRGKKFVELTKDEKSVVHRRYHGLTRSLDQVREEVRDRIIPKSKRMT